MTQRSSLPSCPVSSFDCPSGWRMSLGTEGLEMDAERVGNPRHSGVSCKKGETSME